MIYVQTLAKSKTQQRQSGITVFVVFFRKKKRSKVLLFYACSMIFVTSSIVSSLACTMVSIGICYRCILGTETHFIKFLKNILYQLKK